MLTGAIITSFWGPGRLSYAPVNKDVKTAYSARGQELVPLVHGTMLTVNWDFFVRTEPPSKHARYGFFDGIGPKMTCLRFSNFEGNGNSGKDYLEQTDKSYPVREHKCIWHMT
jgi:hypothetical protein